MASLKLGRLLVVALFGLWLLAGAHARPHHRGRHGKEHSGEKHGSIERLFERSCKATEVVSGFVARDVTCPDGQQCIMGPLPMNINETDMSVMYCDGFKHPPVFPEGKQLPRGVCLVESQGATLFRWGCKQGDDCQYGPYNITFNNQEVEAHFCRDPALGKSSEESHEDASKERPRSAEGGLRRRHHSSEEDSEEDHTRSPRDDDSREDHTHSPNRPERPERLEGNRPRPERSEGGRPSGRPRPTHIRRGRSLRRHGSPAGGRGKDHDRSEEESREDHTHPPREDEDHTHSPNRPERPERSEGDRPRPAHSRRGRSLRGHGRPAGGRGRGHASSEEDTRESREDHTHPPREDEGHTHSPNHPERPERSEGDRPRPAHSRRGRSLRGHGRPAGGRGRGHVSSEEDSVESREDHTHPPREDEGHTHSPNHPERPERSEGDRPRPAHSRRGRSLRGHGRPAGGRGRGHASSEEDPRESREDHTHPPRHSSEKDIREDHTHSPDEDHTHSPNHPEDRPRRPHGGLRPQRPRG